MRVWNSIMVTLLAVAPVSLSALAQAPAAAPAPAKSATPATPATSAIPAASSGAASTAATAPVDGSTFAVRLRDLETRIDELKEQIRRSRTRLSLLSDTILAGGIGGSRAEIKFANDLSNAFRVTKVTVVLDGAVQYNNADDTGALAAQTEIPIFAGPVPPGDHTVQVLVQLRGHGYGVFSYLRGYRFEVKASHSFTLTEGKALQVSASVYEKGGVTTPLEQRPALRFIEKLRGITEGDSAATPAKGGSGSAASGGFSVGAGAK